MVRDLMDCAGVADSRISVACRGAFACFRVSITFKICSADVAALRNDLRRVHAHAGERVGFLFAVTDGEDAVGQVLVPKSYRAIDDEHYLVDSTVGASVGDDALRLARMEALTSQHCFFHVHLHDHRGTPYFSLTDLKSLAEVLPAFAALAERSVHGALLLSADRATAVVWSRASMSLQPIHVNTV